jgi:hypothetical protein
MKFSLLLLFFLFGCASVNYKDPIEMSQEEIAEMKIRNSNGILRDPSVGLIKDCLSYEMGISKNCSKIICKNDSLKSTGLKCLIYHPTDYPF